LRSQTSFEVSKFIDDSLAGIQLPVSNIDLIQCTLNALDLCYDDIVDTFTYIQSTLMFDDIVDSLASHI